MRLALAILLIAGLAACYEPDNSLKTVLTGDVWVHETELTDEFGNYDWPKSFFQFEPDGTVRYWAYGLRSNANLVGSYSIKNNQIVGSFDKLTTFAGSQYNPEPLFLGTGCENPLGENNFSISDLDVNEDENVVRAQVTGLENDCQDGILQPREITLVKNAGGIGDETFLESGYTGVTIAGDLSDILSAADLATYQSFNQKHIVISAGVAGPVATDSNVKNSYQELTGTGFSVKFFVRNQLFGLIDDRETLKSAIVLAVVLVNKTGFDLAEDSRAPADSEQIVVFDSDGLLTPAVFVEQSAENVIDLADIVD